MTYDKETRQEEQDVEIMEDKIKEASNGFDDGAFDSWIGGNIKELEAGFLDEYNDEWREYCKRMWNEENDR
jgi:hypothetical protein